jgi:hypothetical protein
MPSNIIWAGSGTRPKVVIVSEWAAAGISSSAAHVSATFRLTLPPCDPQGYTLARYKRRASDRELPEGVASGTIWRQVTHEVRLKVSALADVRLARPSQFEHLCAIALTNCGASNGAPGMPTSTAAKSRVAIRSRNL